MYAHSCRKNVLVAFAIALGITGCASAGGGGGGGGGSGPNQLNRDDLLSVGQVDAYNAVEQLRRRWLQPRGTASMPVVYVDGTRRGEVDYLRTLQADQVGSMEYLSGTDATTRFGLNHDGGAILVSTDIPVDAPVAGVEQGGNERPRNTDNTRAAESALEDAEDADTPAQAQELYRQALTSAEAAIAENPINPLGHRLAAIANLELGDYRAAGERFDRAGELWQLYELEDVVIREQAFIDRYSEAVPFMNSGQYGEAAELLEGAHAVYPERPEAAVTLAQIYAQQREHDAAVRYIDEALEFMATSERVMEVDEETRLQWQQSVEGLPLMRAQVLADAGRFEEAVGTYREIAMAEPNNIMIRQDLAAILMQMGNESEALEEYEQILQMPGLRANDYYRIGVGYYQIEDYERASGVFEQAVETSPMDRDAVEMWARTLQLDSAFVQAAPAAAQWQELDPASQIAITIEAQAVNQNGDGQRAGEIISRVDDLTFTVDQLQLRRGPNGGGTVNGSVTNVSLNQGDQVTLEFTFYSESGDPLGTVTETVQVGAPEMASVLQVQFDSSEYVGGYSYEIQ